MIRKFQPCFHQFTPGLIYGYTMLDELDASLIELGNELFQEAPPPSPTPQGQQLLALKARTLADATYYFGISYVPVPSPTNVLPRRIPLWQTYGVPLLYPSYEQAYAALSMVAASVEPRYHSAKVESARKLWQRATEEVELVTGRRSYDHETGVMRIIDDRKPTHEQYLEQATTVGSP